MSAIAHEFYLDEYEIAMQKVVEKEFKGNIYQIPEKAIAKLTPKRPLVKLNNRVRFGAFDIETMDGLIRKKLCCASIELYFESGKRNQNKSFFAKGLNSVEECFLEFFEFMGWYFEEQFFDDSSRRSTIIFVHNLSFEAGFIFQFCEKHNIEYSRIGGSNDLAIIVSQFNLVFVDTMNIFNQSQNDVEKNFLPLEFYEQYAKHNTDSVIELFKRMEKGYQPNDFELEQIYLHNKNDVICLLEIMKIFRIKSFEFFHIDILHYKTMAQMAQSAFRTNLDVEIQNPIVREAVNLKPDKTVEEQIKIKFTKTGKCNIFVPKKFEVLTELYKFLNASYFGGRTEIIDKNVRKKVVVKDVNNLYGKAMKDSKIGIADFCFSTCEKELNQWLDNDEFGVIYADIIPNPNLKYPILPYRNKEGTIYYTNQRRLGSYCISELLYAKGLGYIIFPKHGLIARKTERVFVKHIDFCTNLRKIDLVSKEIGKRYANLTYGKFGQKIIRKQLDLIYSGISEEDTKEKYAELEDLFLNGNISDYPEYFKAEIKNSYEFDIKKFGKKLYAYCGKKSAKPFQNVWIASYITANARVIMHKILMQCEQKGIPVYAMDTDSIAIPQQHTNEFPSSNELGQLKDEHVVDAICYFAPKFYLYLEGKEIFIKAKGLGRDNQKELQKDFTLKIADGISFEEVCNQFKQYVKKGIHSGIRYAKFLTQIRHDSSFDELFAQNIEKHFTLKCQKRFFQKDNTSIAWDDTNIHFFKKQYPELKIPLAV